MTIVVEGKRENKKLTKKEAMQILQDIKDGKRDDIPTITVYGKRIEKSELEKFKDAQPKGILKGTIFDYVPDPHQTVIYLQRRQAEKAAERNKKSMGGAMSTKNTWKKTGIEKMKYAYAEGGEAIEDQMGDLMMIPKQEEPMSEMVPDEQMEDDYTDFIIGESLTPEDEEYLLTALEQDDRLSMIFDQVVDTASEFSGSGPVEGPGSGVSDSIPARLSDGEFVLTSKATEEIGPDKLQGMMEQAEQDADVRQMRQEGGYIQEEEEEDTNIEMASQAKVAGQRLIGDQLQDRENQKNMMMLNPRNTLLARRP